MDTDEFGIFIIGVIILAIAIGDHYAAFYGWITVGIGCILCSVISIIARKIKEPKA